MILDGYRGRVHVSSSAAVMSEYQLLAVDRNSSKVAGLYDESHPAVLRALRDIVGGGRAHGREVGICGEMAGDPPAAVLLLGMGVDSLSLSMGAGRCC